MTLEEIERSLPNALHDAKVHTVTVDYAQRKLTIELAVWIGDMEQPLELREAYKEATIRISGLQFFISEAPDPRYPFGNSSGLTVDGCDMNENLNRELLNALPGDVFFRSLWVNEWNAFLHIAGKDASIEFVVDSRFGAKG